MVVNGYKIEPGADLAGANLRYANLKGANLSSADLQNADLIGANLSGAVTVQVRSGSSKTFKTLKNVVSSSAGYFSFKTTVSAKRSFRFLYGASAESAGGSVVSSDIRTVTPRRK